MISKREIHDAEWSSAVRKRTGKYAAIPAARAREEEQKSQMQTAEDIELRKDGRPSANGIGSVHIKTWPPKRYPKAGTLPNTKVGKSSGQADCFIKQTIVLDILRFYQMCSWFREMIQKSLQRSERGFLGGLFWIFWTRFDC